MVLHDKLLDVVFDTMLPNQLKRWLLVYMTGRQSYVEFRGAKSKRRLAKRGVPQGVVLSPILFNLNVSKIPQPPDSVKLVTYADDCSILTTGNNIAELEERLNEYLLRLDDFMEGNN